MLEVTVAIHDQGPVGVAQARQVRVNTLEELHAVCKVLDPSVYTVIEFVDRGDDGEDYMSMTLND